MAVSMNLWKISNNKPIEIQKSSLDLEDRLETWISHDASILGVELLIVGRQIQTAYGGRIDLLGIDRQGDMVILELKRDRTPREIVAQVLDYASWVKKLEYDEINAMASNHLHKDLTVAFNESFQDTLPENINTNHRMLIVASSLDDSSERIVQYLVEEHKVNINAIFFSFFKENNEELLGRAWLIDPEVQERTGSRKQAPWTGFWFVNVGEGETRNWEDNVKYGYISAGQGKKYSDPLKRLEIGDKIFAYMKGLGYVGYGEVIQPAVRIKDFLVRDINKSLLELPLKALKANKNSNDAELSEWVIGIRWIKQFSRNEARTFKGAFANQNIVCKLRSQITLDFLKKEFEIQE